MRTQTAIFGFAIVAICLIGSIDAQCQTPGACTPTECADPANAQDPSCTTTTTTTVATDTTAAATEAVTTTTVSSGATTTTTASSGTGNAARRRLLRRIRRLRRRLNECRKHAAHQRAVLIKKIRSLTASNQSNNMKQNINKLFG